MRKLACFICVIFILNSFCIGAHAETGIMTRLDAVHSLSQLLDNVKEGAAFDDTNDKIASYFHFAGIVHGVGGNKFMPDAPVKTQDFLIMLKKTLDRACPDLFYNNQNVKWYYDQNEIDEYAQSYVRFLSAVGIYDSDGYLEPKSALSREKAMYFINQAQNTKAYAQKSVNGEMYKDKMPILMYHVVDYPTNDNKYLFVTPRDFEQQIKYMYDKGYTFLFPEELSLAHTVSKPVVITFDDGYEQTYTNAYKILKKYNAKATLYIYSDAIDTDGYCSSAQLREMSDSSAFRIYSHAKTHDALSEKNGEEIKNEFAESNDKIYNITKREVTSIAYPFGFINEDVLFWAKRYYKNGFAVTHGDMGIHDIARKTVDGQMNFDEFLELIK